MTKSQYGRRAEKQVIQQLRDIFPDIQPQSPQEHEGGFDAMGRLEQRDIYIEIKATSKPGGPEIEGRLAAAVLASEQQDLRDEIILPIVFAPKIGPTVLKRLQAFMNRNRPNMSWGAIDEKGHRYIDIPELEFRHSKTNSSKQHVDKQNTTTTSQTFTDVNRLLLKHLIYERAPEVFQTALHKGQSINPSQLAQRIDGVSRAKVYQFARTLKDKELLKWDREGFFFPDPEQLFRRWLAVEREAQVETLPVRPLLPGPSFDNLFETTKDSSTKYVIAGFQACRFHNVLHANYEYPEVYVFGDFSTALDELKLEKAEQHNKELCLLSPKHERSIAREVRTDGDVEHSPQYVDLIQTALDVSHHPSRGEEQAEFIINQILGWFDDER